MTDFDVVVIGGGPGGYVAAIRCAQLGFKTACIDAHLNAKGEPTLGGVCLNEGCIPSKALLDSSHHYYTVNHELKRHGININGAELDIATMMKRKNDIVSTLTGGVSLLFAKNKVTWIKASARLLASNRIEYTGHEKSAKPQEVETNHIIIATGSRPRTLEMAPVDGKRIVDSSGALDFDAVPERFAVIGGGVIGLELGSVWSRLGAKTTVFNRRKTFLKTVDQQIASAAYKELTRQGLDIKMDLEFNAIKKGKQFVNVTYTDASGEHTDKFDKLLVATGRIPNSENLNAEAVGLHVNQRGFIEVDDQCRTSVPGVYAIGDVVRGPMLAHKASEEGVAVAERIAGEYPDMSFRTIPWVIYTAPEIAWVGKTAEQLDSKGIKYNSGVFPLHANGRALAMGHTTGMVKILSNHENDEILGVHIFAPSASEMIAEAVVAMEFNASAEDLARTVHAHPTLSEAVHEAALAVDKRTIHL